MMRRMEEAFQQKNPEYFIHVLDTANRMVLRLHAVCALAEIGDESVVLILSRILKSENDPLIRHEAAFSLGQIGLKSGIPALEDAMLNDVSDIVRHEAAAALGSLGAESARPSLEKALSDSSELVAGSAKASLYNLDYLRHEKDQTETLARNMIRP